MWETKKARVLRPFGFYAPGDVITLEGEGEIRKRVLEGYVELIEKPKRKRRKRTPKASTESE